MFSKVACGFRVSRIEVVTNFSTISFTLAIWSSALEDMDSAAIDVFDGGCRLKKNINR